MPLQVCPLIWLRDCHLVNHDVWLAIFSAALGTFGGLLLLMWFEWMKRPKLRITIAPPWDGNPFNTPVRTVRLLVENVSPLVFLRWFIRRQPAFASYAMIDFYRLDGSAVFARPMEARWVSSPEPTQFAQTTLFIRASFKCFVIVTFIFAVGNH
jgi:hypothetical protein